MHILLIHFIFVKVEFTGVYVFISLLKEFRFRIQHGFRAFVRTASMGQDKAVHKK